MAAAVPLIRIEALDVVYPPHGGEGEGEELLAVHALSLDVREGELVGIVGPSGCGKSTLLNVVAGLIPQRAGRVLIGEQEVRGPRKDLGYMLQKDALLPWRTAFANVAVGLQLRGVARAVVEERVSGLLESVGLARFRDHYPHALSGGMRKRVQLAATLAYEPSILLMDEPFGALDAQTKAILESDFLELWDKNRKTVLFVTHDLEEAIALSDRVVLMTANPGTIKEVVPIDLPRPRTVEDAKFHPNFPGIHLKLWASLKEEVGKTLRRDH